MGSCLTPLVHLRVNKWIWQKACLRRGRRAALPDRGANKALRLLHRNKPTSSCCCGDFPAPASSKVNFPLKLYIYLYQWFSRHSISFRMSWNSRGFPKLFLIVFQSRKCVPSLRFEVRLSSSIWTVTFHLLTRNAKTVKCLGKVRFINLGETRPFRIE